MSPPRENESCDAVTISLMRHSVILGSGDRGDLTRDEYSEVKRTADEIVEFVAERMEETEDD